MDICNEKLSSMYSEKFFGIKIDNKLALEEASQEHCAKTPDKKSVLWHEFHF